MTHKNVPLFEKLLLQIYLCNNHQKLVFSNSYKIKVLQYFFGNFKESNAVINSKDSKIILEQNSENGLKMHDIRHLEIRETQPPVSFTIFNNPLFRTMKNSISVHHVVSHGNFQKHLEQISNNLEDFIIPFRPFSGRSGRLIFQVFELVKRLFS